MSTSWHNAPVFYVLAHIQFNAIPVMAKFAGEIADRLRKIGYPDPQEEKQTIFSFGVAPDGSPSPQQVEQKEIPRWSISNTEKTSGFLLLQDALIFHTTTYLGRDIFFAELLKGLEVVNEVIGLSFVDRIGLRYLNTVKPETDERLDQYLMPAALGLGQCFDTGQLQHSMVEAVALLDCGTLISRAFTTNSAGDHPPMPPELMPLSLKVQDRFSPCKGLVAVLDNDCFLQQRIPFSISDIEASLQKLRVGIGLAFDASITDYAKEKWQ
ncbi:MAG: TIGR04255 family protein [Gammaproteobacteria bacterium]|jgi:uncharacterized protein (TIGR04255 family)|nr:TIGR04255 family protein [Gammaproteobacteria bacterium]